VGIVCPSSAHSWTMSCTGMGSVNPYFPQRNWHKRSSNVGVKCRKYLHRSLNSKNLVLSTRRWMVRINPNGIWSMKKHRNTKCPTVSEYRERHFTVGMITQDFDHLRTSMNISYYVVYIIYTYIHILFFGWGWGAIIPAFFICNHPLILQK